MNTNPLPPIELLREVFEILPTGVLIWKERPLSHFQDERAASPWNAKHAGKIAGSTRNGYRVVRINGSSYYIHRIILASEGVNLDGAEVDHINGNKSDNRPSNLRLSNHCENKWNRGMLKNNQSGVKGVSWQPQRGKWQATIRSNGRQIHLGRFNTKDEAESAVRYSREKLHGEFAHH